MNLLIVLSLIVGSVANNCSEFCRAKLGPHCHSFCNEARNCDGLCWANLPYETEITMHHLGQGASCSGATVPVRCSEADNFVTDQPDEVSVPIVIDLTEDDEQEFASDAFDSQLTHADLEDLDSQDSRACRAMCRAEGGVGCDQTYCNLDGFCEGLFWKNAVGGFRLVERYRALDAPGGCGFATCREARDSFVLA